MKEIENIQGKIYEIPANLPFGELNIEQLAWKK